MVGSICRDTPPIAWFNTVLGSNFVKRLAWAGLLPNIRRSYQIAICSHEYFVLYCDFKQWNTTIEWLEKWATTRIMSFQVDKQIQVFPETVQFYLSLLQAFKINYGMSLHLFKGIQLSILIKVGKQSFPHTNVVSLPITREILLKITGHQLTDGY